MDSAAEQERLRGSRFGSAALSIELVERSRWLVGPHLGILLKAVACALVESIESSGERVGVVRSRAPRVVGLGGALASPEVKPFSAHSCA